jgi:hypothetical protein
VEGRRTEDGEIEGWREGEIERAREGAREGEKRRWSWMRKRGITVDRKRAGEREEKNER